MPDWKKHVLGGLITTSILLFFINSFKPIDIQFIGLSLLVSFIYSQLPDIDIQSSKIRWIVTVVGIGIAFVELAFLNNPTVSIISMGTILIIWLMGCIKGFGHRGFLHGYLFSILFPCLMLYHSVWLALVAFNNYVTHIIMDAQ
jgi:membrane-bound metal-dependent hydrolase YbcI (DUF457 family)